VSTVLKRHSRRILLRPRRTVLIKPTQIRRFSEQSGRRLDLVRGCPKNMSSSGSTVSVLARRNLPQISGPQCYSEEETGLCFQGPVFFFLLEVLPVGLPLARIFSRETLCVKSYSTYTYSDLSKINHIRPREIGDLSTQYLPAKQFYIFI
jgi:hypothetical protein